MKLSHHIIIGIVGSLPIYLFTKSPEVTFVYIVSNSFIDVDHFFDFWYDHGFNLSWKKFYKACNTAGFVHFFICLHSFEVLFLISIFLYFFRNSHFYSYILGILCGFSCHLISDILYNSGVKLKYFFMVSRYMKNFEFDKICAPTLLKEVRKR